MTLALNLTVTGLRETINQLSMLPAAVGEAIYQMVQRQVLLLQAHVVRDKLSGQVLNVRSGALRRSIQARVEKLGELVVRGFVYSAGDVKYAGIHEFGGKTAPHDIYPTHGQALRFAMGGETVFAKVVHHPGSQMPERSYLRSGLYDRASDIEEDARQTVAKALERVMTR